MLTAKQKEYCKGRADGLSYKDAYIRAGYADNGDKVTTNNAYTLENLSAHSREILERIAELQARAEAGGILKREQRQQLLSDIALDTEGARADRIRALDLLAKMSGDYTERMIYEGTAFVSIEDARREAWDALRGDE